MRHAARVLLAMFARILRGFAEFLSRLAERRAEIVPPPAPAPPRPPESWLERANPPPPAHWLARVRAAAPEETTSPPAHGPDRVRSAAPTPPGFARRLPDSDGSELREGRTEPAPEPAPRPRTGFPSRHRPALRGIRFEERRRPGSPPTPPYAPEPTPRPESPAPERPPAPERAEVSVAFDRPEEFRPDAALRYPPTDEGSPLPTAWSEPDGGRRTTAPSYPSSAGPSAAPELRFDSREEPLLDAPPSYRPTAVTEERIPSYPARVEDRAGAQPSAPRKVESDPWPELPEPASGDLEDAWKEHAREAERRCRLDREQRGPSWNE